jgi:glyoxylase-like metal-dependent hydrolase (beta-lactamase superfamily II)
MESISPGVFTLPMEFESGGSTRQIHPAAVETDRGLILVDTGFPYHVDAIERHLEDEGLDFEDIRQIVVTHQDLDHAGALREVADRSDAITAAHPDDAPAIADPDERIKESEYPLARVDVEIVDGVRYNTVAGPMVVVATPGHTPGHLSLYFPEERLLLAGDAITAEDSFDGPSESATADMDAAVESIGRLAELSVDRTLCFHGGLVEHDPDRLEEVYETLSNARA